MAGVTWLQPGEGREFPLRWQTRLRAWWEGYDLTALRLLIDASPASPEVSAAPAPAGTLAEPEPESRFGKPLWTAARLGVAEAIWGEGFTSPGGLEHAFYLVKPFGITSSMSVLDLSAGLGGIARAVAKEYKAWVTGHESSPLLAGIGRERSEKLGMAKNAPISAVNLENFKLDRRYDCIFAKEAFFTVANKDVLFDRINEGLKAGGQLCFTDYCLETADLTDPTLVGWLSSEPVEPHLWTMQRITDALKARKIFVRTNEDITHLQKSLILSALGAFLAHLEAHRMDRETKLAVLEEVELWARRVQAFDAGLRVYRFYCMKS